LASNTILFRKTPLEVQNDYIFLILGGNGPFGPPGFAYALALPLEFFCVTPLTLTIKPSP